MPIISISISSELYEQLDEFIEKGGYSSRSEAIRDSVRNLLSEFELRKFDKGKITATITVISERERQFIDERLMRLRHEYDEIVSANMHIHLGDNFYQ
jgi:CopG family nickel-responsive transcriptional regulator